MSLWILVGFITVESRRELQCFSINVSVSQIIVYLSITCSIYERFRFLYLQPSSSKVLGAVGLVRTQESLVSQVDGVRIIVRKIILEVLSKWAI